MCLSIVLARQSSNVCRQVDVRSLLCLFVSLSKEYTITAVIPLVPRSLSSIRENEKPIWNNGNRTRLNHAGIESVSRDDDAVVVKVGSGEYSFELEPIGR